MPPTFSASCSAAWFATGIHVGFGSPSPCVEVSFVAPKRLRLRMTVIELFSVCITSRMITRSDHLRGIEQPQPAAGCAAASSRNCHHRCRRVPPSVSSVFSRPIALLPLP